MNNLLRWLLNRPAKTNGNGCEDPDIQREDLELEQRKRETLRLTQRMDTLPPTSVRVYRHAIEAREGRNA